MVEVTRSQMLALRSRSVKSKNSWSPMRYNKREFFTNSTITSLVILGLGTVKTLDRKSWAQQPMEDLYLPEYCEDKNGMMEVFIPNPGAYFEAKLRSYPNTTCCPNCGHNFDAKMHRRKGKRT